MKRTLAIFGLNLLCVGPAVGQLSAPQKFTPTKFCSSSDNNLECAGQRNQANIDRYVDKYKEEVRRDAEKQRAEQQERDRLRTIREKDCNPHVQRCD